MEYKIPMKFRKGKKILSSTFLISVLAIGMFLVGFFVGEKSVFCDVCQPSEINFSLFWEAYNKVREGYLDPGKIDIDKVIYGAISGMVESLEDPYTVFMSPNDTKMFLDDISGSFEGVGMEISIKDGQLTVITPLEGTPAQKAGLMPGDKVVQINGESTLDISIDEAARLIRGDRGTMVTLTVFRENWDSLKDFEIVRDVIEIPSMSWKMLDNNVAHIRIHHFSQNADLDFNKIAVEILAQGAEKIILDLRNNPGGYLEVASSIAGAFVQSGKVVVIEDTGEEQKEHLARGSLIFLQRPVVVLINQGSASASEILAGALRDNNGVKLIGKTSFGKGSVQQMEMLSGGSSIKVTIAEWLTPNGETINEVGLEPDIEVEMTIDDVRAELDPQLDKAIEIIERL